MKTKVLALAAFAVLTASSSYASSATLVQQSHQLETIVSELRTEFRSHYDHTSVYAHLVNDARAIEQQADHIHQLAHNYYASTRHILSDLEKIDQLAHHIHEMVDAADSGRYGHVHGSTRHVHGLLNSLTTVIHNMEKTVRHDASHGGGHGHGHGHGHGGHDRGHDDDHGHGDHGHASKGAVEREVATQIVREVFRFFSRR